MKPSTSKKRFLSGILVIVVILSLLAVSINSSMVASGSPSIPNNKQAMDLANTNSVTNANDTGYVKYTLDLFNNTLINGNIGNTGNGLSPKGLAYDSTNNYLYVTNYGSNNVSVINGTTNTVIKSITVGSSPIEVAYDPVNNYLYVTNSKAGSVSIISTGVLLSYVISFTESGLPSGTTWYVNLTNGQSFSSATSTVSLPEPNGTYSYTIGTVSGYTASPSSGSITVSGSNATKTITFAVTSTPSKPSSIELYGIIGAAGAVAIIGTALAIMRKRR